MYNFINKYKGAFNVKKIFSVLIIMALVCSLFYGCNGKKTIESVSGEIIVNDKNCTVSFTVKNNTGKNISSLSGFISVYSKDKIVVKTDEVKYPIEVKNGDNATLTLNVESCASARLDFCTFKGENGDEKRVDFKEKFVVYPKEKSEETIKTREEVAEKIIRDVKSHFLAQGSFSEGHYNPDKKSLVIVSTYDMDADTCITLYQKEPDMWKSLEDGIVSMSQSCLDDFKANNFDDVTVNVGVMSKDEELLFSATDGQLVKVPQ